MSSTSCLFEMRLSAFLAPCPSLPPRFTRTTFTSSRLFLQPSSRPFCHSSSRPSSPLLCPFLCSSSPRPSSSPTPSSQKPSSPKPSPPNPSPLTAIPIGLTGGLIGSLIGAGGGVINTPLLTTFIRLPQHKAHGTSLAAVAFTATAGAIRYNLSSHISYPAAALICLPALLTSPLGASLASSTNSRALKALFGAFLIAVAILIPTLPAILASAPAAGLSVASQRAVLVAVGAVTGLLSGLLGIGGGTVAVPAIVLLTGLSQKTAQGTALLAMIAPSVLGAATHARKGNVDMRLLPGLAVGALLGGTFGGSVAVYLPEQTLRIVCSVVFAGIGLRYISQNMAEKKETDASV